MSIQDSEIEKHPWATATLSFNVESSAIQAGGLTANRKGSCPTLRCLATELKEEGESQERNRNKCRTPSVLVEQGRKTRGVNSGGWATTNFVSTWYEK